MSLACLKYSLAFVLGAMSLAILIIFQLQTNVIRVHIRWKHPTFLGHSAFVPAVADNLERHGRLGDTIHLHSPLLSTNDTASDAENVAVVQTISSQERDGVNTKKKSDTIVLLNRSAREIQNTSSSVNLKSDTVHMQKRGHDQRKQNARTRKSKPPNNAEQQQSVMSIEDALSKTAPDWLGPTLPPVELTDINAVCDDSLCMSRLTEVERSQFDKCVERANVRKEAIGPISSEDFCHFQNGTNRHPVALASFPGSGNTWMRGLLQKITGICTGSLYCDSVLRARGFPGEFLRGPSVIAIKVHGTRGRFTHGQLPRRIFNNSPIYGAAILLVRDPKSALVAEWHRERTSRQTNATSSSHSLYTGEVHFKNNEDWNTFIEEKGKWWSNHVTGWIISGKDNPFHIVRYEDLKNDTVTEMKKVMEFLGFPHLSEADIAERLGQGFNQFYRNHKDSFSHFTEEQSAFIHQQVLDAISTLKEYGLENVFPIYEYL